jgi:hypothetical protein
LTERLQAAPPRLRNLAPEDEGEGDGDGDGDGGGGVPAGNDNAAAIPAAPLSEDDVACNTGIARPADGGEFAATVVAAAADTEFAFDNGFTPALVKALQDNPGLTVDDIFRRISAGPVENEIGVLHPTIVQYGQRSPSAAEGGGAIKKRAMLIANQNYGWGDPLHTPIAEAEAMQSELASRGFEASVHCDQPSRSMDALWGSMVGAANPGDQLVAFYGGHGSPEGLLGVDREAPPSSPDLFTNQQVAGVVSEATGKGARIRMIMDSCHSGTAAQEVREIRENELAATARSAGDQLRVAALLGVRQMKQQLLEIIERRMEILVASYREAKHRCAGGPASTDAPRTRHLAVEHSVDDSANGELREDLRNAFERAVDRLWSELLPLLAAIRTAVGHMQEPPPITDYETLGAQLNYLDDLWNAVSQAMEHAAADADADTDPAGAAGSAPP